MVVWLLTGLWHGAAWNFMIWGLYFGILLIVEKVFLSKYLEKIPKILRHIYTLIIVMISFVIFNGESTEQIMQNIGGLVGINSSAVVSLESLYHLKSYLLVLLVGFIGATPILKNFANKEKIHKVMNCLETIFLLLILTICTSYIIDGSFNPFLYFRF